ncbi:MAG: hypothetical protein AAF221_06500 [Pseudomonadota bacterium]
MKSPRHAAASGLMSLSLLLACIPQAQAETLKVPADTRLFLTTQEELVGKKGAIIEGQRVRAQIWKDVVVEGRTIIRAGTPAMVKVDFFKRNKIAGRKGKITLGAYEVEATDGSALELTGGYYKQGSGRIFLTSALAGIVFLPLIFIKGGKAKLPEGTVFDAFTARSAEVDVPPLPSVAAPTDIDILEDDLLAAGLVRPDRAQGVPALSVEFLYSDMEKEEKPKAFPIEITAPAASTDTFTISHINGEPASGVKVEGVSAPVCGPWRCTYRASIAIKPLIKKFSPGLNTVRLGASDMPNLASDDVLVEVEI